MKTFLASALLLVLPLTSWAWGRRGHEIVGQTAAYLASGEEGAGDLKAHSFDIGYYANVPDFFWKRPATYALEKPNHFMDMEIFERELPKKPEIKEPFKLSRKEFEAAFPEIKPEAGRAFWRIREFDEQLEKLGVQIRELKPGSTKEQMALQEKWILLAGLMAHYIGDLGMPLHVSENYDGLITNQKGIHSYFEDVCVDELFPRLADQALTEARKLWPVFKTKNGKRTTLELVQDLATSSQKEVRNLLAIDKASKREDIKKTCAKYDKMIAARMAQSSLVLAELYRRSLGWKFDNNKFFFFAGEPEFIPPGQASAAPLPAAPVAAKQ